MTLSNLNKLLNILFLITFNFFVPASPVTIGHTCTSAPIVVTDFVFEDYESPAPPAKLTITQDFDASKPAEVSRINVTATNITEDFYISLIANPYVKTEVDCNRCKPTDNDINNFRLYKHTCPMLVTAPETTKRSFKSIFTGCYHFLMTSNSSEKHWLHPPVFYNGTYRYLDTLLRPEQYKFKPENTDSTMVLRALLEVPLDCIEVHVWFWELDKNVKNAITLIKNSTLPPTLECIVSINNGIIVSDCGATSTAIRNLTLEGYLVKKDEDGWTGILEWKNLTRGGWQYQLYFFPSTMRKCDGVMGDWRLIQQPIYVDLGYRKLNNAPFLTPRTYDFPWFLTACGLISVITIVIIMYWIKKYRNLVMWPGNENEDRCAASVEPLLPLNERESDQILLMYEKGSSLFMKEMEELRNNLEQQCRGFNIHDVYAINEWNRVRQLGAPGWVQELLKGGSKIVWVDTPQFRSRLNDKQHQYTANDFRDDAVPYAVTVVTDSFINSITQYRRHFVVRMNGVEVRDGCDDPLRVVSPHARYYLPDQLDRLCNDLKGPMKLMEKKAAN